jgi:hypothetical protein
MGRARAIGLLAIALVAACSPSPTVPSPTAPSASPAAEPVVAADAVNDVVGSESDPVPLAPVDDSRWIDIRTLTVSRTTTDLHASISLLAAPDATAFMTYSIEIDTSGDGVADYSVWAEYFGDGNARPGLVPWGAEEALFDEAFPGSLTVDDKVLTWTVLLEFMQGESLRVGATAQQSGEPKAILVAQDWVPDTLLNEATRQEVYSWIAVPFVE